MKSAEIREKFLRFFAERGHTVVRSSSLVPGNDPTMLLTNAGMVQFKDVFLGIDTRPYTRAASVQRCVRAGGKHNDLENVGYTARHHTFFEMLGNFSFGDYFKEEAITCAWELLTKGYGISPDRLWVTVYHEDDEAFAIWEKEVGLPKERILRIGDNKGARYASDNFWQMADVGPCGPCSEIFYDHGPEVAGGLPGTPEEEGDRYIEIWNLVFMQFNRDEAGNLSLLPKPCVDTGMGLERLAAVLQGVHSNYDIDLFRHLIRAAARETGTQNLADNSLKVIADHIRAAAFMIVDGLVPGSEGHGYVLRRIIRRALRHGHKLGQSRPFFHRLVKDLSDEMGSAYPELPSAAERVTQVLLHEETRFGETLEHGMKILDIALGDNEKQLAGETAFTLYDTYGFPLDLTADICRERGVALDMAGFESAMAQQKEMARTAGKFKMAAVLEYQGEKTDFVGYDHLQDESKIVALYADGVPVAQLRAGQEGVVVLDKTPFYAESGGQVGDVGTLSGSGVSFDVSDTRKIQPEVTGHEGVLSQGTLSVGDRLQATIRIPLRQQTMRNHSATHLMHKALRQVLGEHVAQRGSLVDAEKTRFDFSHHAPLTPDEIVQIEKIVNEEIVGNQPVLARVLPYDEAIASGAVALFGEKYGDSVRVLNIGFSCELCGGTHVSRTGDIGLFKIASEGGVAAGVRRVEAVTGMVALEYVQANARKINDAASALKTSPDELVPRILQMQDRGRTLERELSRTREKAALGQGSDMLSSAVDVEGIKVLAVTMNGMDAAGLRNVMDKLKDRLKTAAIVLATVNDDKVSLIAGVTSDVTNKIRAGDMVNHVARQIGGKGGGRPDMAQAGGNEPSKLPQALDSVVTWVRAQLTS